MARKRITESDLLDDRVRAAELSRAVESKYEELDRLKREQPAPVRRMGVLLLPDAAEGRDALRALAVSLEHAEIAVERVDVLGYRPVDRFDRTPGWQRRLIQAQNGYLALKERANRRAVVGVGSSCALAALIAEQYPVDALVCVGEGLGRKWGVTGASGSPRISRIAGSNLFSIVCPALVLAPERARFDLDAGTRSRDARRIDFPVSEAREIWTARAAEMEEAIRAFLAEC